MSEDGTTQAILTPEQAKKVLRRNVQNLVKKVQDGKMLTAQELATVEGLAEGREPGESKGWAKNKVELADQLGITRMSLDNWLKLGAPAAHSNGLWNVNDWREWMRQNSKKSTKAAAGAEAGPSKSQLEAKRLLLMNQKLEHEISILKGEWTKNEDIERQIEDMVTEAKKVLLAMPDALAPQVVGLTVPEAAKRIREYIDDALLRLHAGSAATP